MPSSLQKGINAAKAGQTEKALEHLKDAIIEEPQNADVWVWIAAIIADQEKQEIFLKKALEIDPQNIPAQRGLSYLKKRGQHDDRVMGETLSDHTQPISPFPNKNQRPQPDSRNREFERRSDALVNLTGSDTEIETPESQNATSQQPPRLTAFEIVLLCVVVVVFAFIGLLASSALLDFELPLGIFSGNRPRLATKPPYPGVFLYEEEVFFDIEGHQGPPVTTIGIPTSSSSQPVILFWGVDVDTNSLNLIHESGTFVDYRTYQRGENEQLVQPSAASQEGLYCLQETQQQPPSSLDTFYCFRIDLFTGE